MYKRNHRAISREFYNMDCMMRLTNDAKVLYTYILLNSDDDGFCDTVEMLMSLTNNSYTELEELSRNELLIIVLQSNKTITLLRNWHDHMCDTIKYENNSKYLSFFQGEDAIVYFDENTNRYEFTDESLNEINERKETQKNKKNKNKEEEQRIDNIIDLFNDVTGRSFSKKTEKTRSLIRTLLKLEPLKEDAEEKILMTIRYKYEMWKDDEKMQAFIRPQTLLGNKFESYLNEAMSSGNNKKEQFGNVI